MNIKKMTEDEMIEKSIKNAKQILSHISYGLKMQNKDVEDFVDFVVGASVLQAKKEIMKELGIER